jgi:Cas10/Cmr2, second palm domain
MPTYAYLFEAKSIQAYLLSTNRLREIVGGSELVEGLTAHEGLLDDVMQAIGSGIEFSRRGGAAFFAFSQEHVTIAKLAALWPLLVRQHAPDLSFTQAGGEGETAFEAFQEARPQLLDDRNRLSARLPQAGPFAVRHRRTGEPAVSRRTTKGVSEPVDAATARKQRFAAGKSLAARFAPQESPQAWPLNLTPEEGEEEGRDFPFQGDSRLIALVHADGNCMGRLLMHLVEIVERRPADYLDIFRRFSNAIRTATENAAQRATQAVLAPKRKNGTYPARPIVLGGDDLTMIVRADLALPFTRAFLEAFAVESRNALYEIKSAFGLDNFPERLTACAGVAYAKASQPFYLLHGLAEGLCTHAKSRGRQAAKGGEVPSGLSLHRVSTAFVDSYGDVLARELTSKNLRQTLETYAIERGRNLPALNDLLSLQGLLDEPELARGGSRELLGLIGRDPDQAKRRYKRWREVMRDRLPEQLRTFDGLMKQLVATDKTAELPFGPADDDGLRRSPLGDVVALQAVGNETPTDIRAETAR